MCERHEQNSGLNCKGLGMALAAAFGGATDARADDRTTDATEHAVTDATAQAAVKPARRRKLWELEEKLHCPVIGTCLPVEDLKKIARREGFNGKSFDLYQLHVEAVSASCARNSTSVHMHRLLERKYARWVKNFEQAKSEEAVMTLWTAHFDQGEIAGPMWAALTHRHAGERLNKRVYGDVHMLSHQVGASLAADARKLSFLETENARLVGEARQEQTRFNQRLAEQAARIRYLEGENSRLGGTREELAALQARLQTLESGQAMIEMGRRLLLLNTANAKQQESLSLAQQRICQLEREAEQGARLQKDLASVCAERDALEKLLLAAGNGAKEDASCNGDCAACEDRLRGRCVLCVGGRATLLPQYRTLAQRLGVRLIHHDGGKEASMARLPELLAASDAVICPTDCVSHGAYYLLKRHCKTLGKPCVLTPNSGVGGFAAALTKLAESPLA